MAKLSKRVKAIKAKVDRNKSYGFDNAVALIKEFATAKFNESIDVSIQLGVDPTLTARIQSGFDVGPETIGGLACEHYAFRQAAADWQVWIRTDGAALPCKMVITTTQDEAQPQYTAVMTWDAKAPAQSAYTFNPPANAHRITVADLSAAGAK